MYLFHIIISFKNYYSCTLIDTNNVLDAFDPCLVGNFVFLHKPGLRGGKCQLQPGKVVCDRFIDNGWYKVLHEDDLKPRKMLEGIVSQSYCGTSFPIWLNGKISSKQVLSFWGFCYQNESRKLSKCNHI